MTVQCCNCHKIRGPKGWKDPEKMDLSTVAVSHTYCPACYAYFRLKMEQWKRRRASRNNLT